MGLGQALLLILALGPQLLLGLVDPSLVLCQEAGGNVAIEWELAACCDGATDCPEQATACLHEADPCGPCSDSQLERSLRDERPTEALSSLPARPVHPTVLLPRPPVVRARVAAWQGRADAARIVPDLLRTVVIRS